MDFEELVCGICSQYFDNAEHLPRLVPKCGHTYCSKCIEDIILEKSTPLHYLFYCPEDKMTITLKSPDITDFPKNFLLARLANKRETMVQNKASIITFNQEKSESAHDQNLGHSNFLSSSAGSQETEERSSILNGSPQKTVAKDVCKEHGKIFEIICLDHNCRICSNCALFGAHRNHNIKPEGDVIKDIALRAEHLIDVFQSMLKQEKAIHDEDRLGQMKKQMKERRDMLVMLIQERFSEYIRMIMAHEKTLIEDLDHKFGLIREKLYEATRIPNDLQERLKQWKLNTEEAFTIINDKSEKGEIPFDLLKLLNGTKNDISLTGEKLVYELKKTKDAPAKAYESEWSKVTVVFNDNFPKFLNMLGHIMDSDSSETTIIPTSNSKDSINQSISQKSLKSEITPFMIEETKNNFASSRSHNTKTQTSSEAERIRREVARFEESSQYGYNKENIDLSLDPTGSRTANFGQVSIDTQKSILEDSDLLDFELKDLAMDDLCDLGRKFSKSGAPSNRNQNNILDKVRYSDSNVLGVLGNLTNRNIPIKSPVSQKGKQITMERAGQNTYTRVYRDSSRTPTRKQSVSPMKRDTSADRTPKQMKAKKRIEIQVSDKYEAVVEGIKNNTIEHADLTGAELGDHGIEKLAEYLKENTRLKSLKLLKNKIMDEGGLALANALCYNRTMQVLNLTQNYLTEKTMDAFIELFSMNRSIRTIYFNQNSISLRSVKGKIRDMISMGVNVSI